MIAVYCDTCGYPHLAPQVAPQEDSMAANVLAMAHLLDRNILVNHAKERAYRILSFAFLCMLDQPWDDENRQRARQVYSLYCRIE